MSRRRLAASVAAGLFSGFIAAPIAPLAAAVAPSARITPQTVAINRPATLVGSHFPANSFFTLLVVLSHQKKPIRAFVSQLARSDRHGNISLHFRVPIVTKCGPANVYILSPGASKVEAHVSVQVSGCTAPKGTRPPAPPGRKPKKP